jgi:hypothetical protein
MGGGLLQLVAYGAQDVYLTGNPQITFFKVVYRRHTNFSIESIQQTFNGNAALGSRVTCQISRNGDLVHKLYLEVVGTNLATASGNKGAYQLVDKVELEIGGQLIDRQYGDWMHIWNELTLPSGKTDGFNNMVNGPTKLYIPLEFWFCRNVGLALPLIALQYHEVKVNIEFKTYSSVNPQNQTSTPVLTSATLWADYIFLDTDERRRFAQLSHEYLIEQVQFTGDESVLNASQASVKMSFNHPVKELIWRIQTSSNNYVIAENAKIMLNGNDRFSQRDGSYFTDVQPYQHHTNIPAVEQGIHVYSFAIKPEEHQPSGTLNMSRIDTASLTLKLKSTETSGGTLKLYAVNYNVLRILSGMGGLAYSN